MLNSVFDGIVYYLQVFIPFGLTVFSVVSRLIAGTMNLSVRNFMKVYNDIVLGSLSFFIWGLIQWHQTGNIDLNTEVYLPPAKLVVLLIMGLVLLFVAATVSRYEWKAKEGEWTADKKERVADWTMLVITIGFFVLPLALVSKTEKGKQAGLSQPTSWVVSFGWEDPSVLRQVGPAWGNKRRVSGNFRVTATGAQDAREKGMRKLIESGLLTSTSKKHEPLKVDEDSVCVGQFDWSIPPVSEKTSAAK
jgi:hypothetical protein